MKSYSTSPYSLTLKTLLCFKPPPLYTTPLPRFSTPAPPLMAARANHESSNNTITTTNPVRLSPSVDKMQEFVHQDPFGGWDKCWEEGLSPWDLGQPTPILQHLLQNHLLPKGRALVPGCGSGYDVVTLASPERFVIGLDISDFALKKAKQGIFGWLSKLNRPALRLTLNRGFDQPDHSITLKGSASGGVGGTHLASTSPNSSCFSFLKADFFTWNPTELFDLIFDYTFFCAIVPDMRSAWATRMSQLLKPDGELITSMFSIDDHDGGPPYKTSVADYEAVLHPLRFHATSVVENELEVLRRKGREKLGRWRRTTRVSPL